jgi:hypothetical protein
MEECLKRVGDLQEFHFDKIKEIVTDTINSGHKLVQEIQEYI